MNISNESLANDLNKAAALLERRILQRLKPSHENEYEYWQACFAAAREYPNADYLQTKAANALNEIIPCLKN